MSGTGSGYDLSCTTYSPEGKIYQVEYATKAVENSGTVVAVQCKDGIVIGVENIKKSKMLVKGACRRTYPCDRHCGLSFSGLIADGLKLVEEAQSECKNHRDNFGEPIPIELLANRVAQLIHLYTCYWYARPFGCSVIISGYDYSNQRYELYSAEPSGVCLRYRGNAIGKGQSAAKTEIGKYDLNNKSCIEATKYVAKIMHSVHDSTKDKPFELEMGWINDSINNRFELIPQNIVDEADQWARAEIERDAQADDDDEE